MHCSGRVCGTIKLERKVVVLYILTIELKWLKEKWLDYVTCNVSWYVPYRISCIVISTETAKKSIVPALGGSIQLLQFHRKRPFNFKVRLLWTTKLCRNNCWIRENTFIYYHLHGQFISQGQSRAWGCLWQNKCLNVLTFDAKYHQRDVQVARKFSSL